MPNVKVRTEPRDGTIYFMDGVGTSDTTYTYDMPQSEFTLQNTGTRRIIWSVGPYSEVIVEPGATDTRAIDAGVTSFKIRAEYHYQSFSMRSMETPVENPSLDARMDGLDAQLADVSKQEMFPELVVVNLDGMTIGNMVMTRDLVTLGIITLN